MTTRRDAKQLRGTRDEFGAAQPGLGQSRPIDVSFELGEQYNQVQRAMEGLVTELNRQYGDAMRYIDDQGRMWASRVIETITKKLVHGGYLDASGRPIRIRRATSGVDVEGENAFDKTSDKVNDALIDAARALVAAGYVDANKRPNKLRKAAGDVGADDVFDKTADTVGDSLVSAGRALVNDQYVDGSKRPNRLRKTTGDLTADNALDKSTDSLANVPDDPVGTWRRVAGVDASNKATDSSVATGRALVDSGYVDVSKRPFKLRRTTAGTDVDAEDVSKQAEVRDHIGGLNVDNVRSAANQLLLDVTNEELYRVQVMGGVYIGGTSPLGCNKARAGATRGLIYLSGSGRLYGYVREGITAYQTSGSSVWGITSTGDGYSIDTDSGTGNDDDTGDSGGEGDPVE